MDLYFLCLIILLNISYVHRYFDIFFFYTQIDQYPCTCSSVVGIVLTMTILIKMMSFALSCNYDRFKMHVELCLLSWGNVHRQDQVFFIYFVFGGPEYSMPPYLAAGLWSSLSDSLNKHV